MRIRAVQFEVPLTWSVRATGVLAPALAVSIAIGGATAIVDSAIPGAASTVVLGMGFMTIAARRRAGVTVR